MDVTSSESVNRAAAEIKDEAIDVLINSAGIIGAPNQTDLTVPLTLQMTADEVIE
jgi:NAD(P)-dependent dehydrogenase (short-subunit alcohol dehydrogenase family)